MLADGRYVWNAGIFLLRSDRLIEELAVHAPGLLGSVRKIWRPPIARAIEWLPIEPPSHPWRRNRSTMS
jgi:mannose-1-phosphate guanylyltransferase